MCLVFLQYAAVMQIWFTNVFLSLFCSRWKASPHLSSKNLGPKSAPLLATPQFVISKEVLGRSNLMKKSLLFFVDSNLVWPPPCNSDHQDYYMFSRGFLLTFTFHCYREGAISKIQMKGAKKKDWERFSFCVTGA